MIPFLVRVIDRQAMCTCGWSGRARWFRALAVNDAHCHAYETLHMPLSPLVVA